MFGGCSLHPLRERGAFCFFAYIPDLTTQRKEAIMSNYLEKKKARRH